MNLTEKFRQWIDNLRVGLYVTVHRCPLMRMNNNWLYYRTYKELQKTNPELFLPIWKLWWKKRTEYVFSMQGWWIMVLVAFSPFWVTCLAPPFLRFIPIEAETARELLEQRAGQLATLVSLALVVAGFLMNVMAGKNKLTTETLIKNSRIFPITVFSLGVVAYLIALSTFRDVWINNPSRFNDLFLAGSYMALGVMGLIGFLFFRVLSYIDSDLVKEINEKSIEKKLRAISRSKYLIKESHEKLKTGIGDEIDLRTGQRDLPILNEVENSKKSKSSGRDYRRVSIPNNHNNSLKKHKKKQDTSFSFTNSLIINDINIKGLKGSLKQEKDSSITLSFSGLHESADSLWVSSSHFNSKFKEPELRKAILTTVKKNKKGQDSIDKTVYEHYKGNLITALFEYNNEQLNKELVNIEQFYNLLIKGFQLADKYVDLISAPITDLIIDVCIKTIQNKDERKTEEFLLFIDRIIWKAIDHYQVALMGRYLSLLVRMYEEIKKAMPQVKDVSIDLASRIQGIFTSGFDFHLSQKVLQPDSCRVKDTDGLFFALQTEYSRLFYKSIELKDDNLAKELLKALDGYYTEIHHKKRYLELKNSKAYDYYIQIRNFIRYSLYFETIGNRTLFNELEEIIPAVSCDVEDFLKKLTSFTKSEFLFYTFFNNKVFSVEKNRLSRDRWLIIGYLLDIASGKDSLPTIAQNLAADFLKEYSQNDILKHLDRTREYLTQITLPWNDFESFSNKKVVDQTLEELIEQVTNLFSEKAATPQVPSEETTPSEGKTTEDEQTVAP